jgi:hypothetical protein
MTSVIARRGAEYEESYKGQQKDTWRRWKLLVRKYYRLKLDGRQSFISGEIIKLLLPLD